MQISCRYRDSRANGPFVTLPADQPKHYGMRVWANLFNGDAVARFDPTTATWTEFPLPTRGVEMRHIAFTEQNGTTEIVLSYFRAGKVARMQFRTTEQLESLQAQVRAAEVQAKK